MKILKRILAALLIIPFTFGLIVGIFASIFIWIFSGKELDINRYANFYFDWVNDFVK